VVYTLSYFVPEKKTGRQRQSLVTQNARTNQRYPAGNGRGEESDDEFYQVE